MATDSEKISKLLRDIQETEKNPPDWNSVDAQRKALLESARKLCAALETTDEKIFTLLSFGDVSEQIGFEHSNPGSETG